MRTVHSPAVLCCALPDHGWRFEGAGKCTTIPQGGDPANPRACATAYQCTIKQGELALDIQMTVVRHGAGGMEQGVQADWHRWSAWLGLKQNLKEAPGQLRLCWPLLHATAQGALPLQASPAVCGWTRADRLCCCRHDVGEARASWGWGCPSR